MKFLAGSSPVLLGLLGLLMVSHGPQAASAETSLTPKAFTIPSAPTRAPTNAPSAVVGSPTAAAPAAPAVADDLLQDEKENPVVVIDLKVAGATEEQVEAVAAFMQYFANMPFQNTNNPKINVTVEWRGTVVEGGSSPTRFLRALPPMPAAEQGLRQLVDDEDENKGKNRRCSLNVGDTANVTTITIHGLHGKAHINQIEQFLSFLSSGVLSINTADQFPAFNFVCASEVRMSNEAPSMQFQVMNAEEEEEKKGPNTAAIVVPIVFGVAFLGAVGFVLVKKFAVGAAVPAV